MSRTVRLRDLPAIPVVVFLPVLLILLALSAPRAEIVLQGIHCPPGLWVHQTTKFSHFGAYTPAGEAPALVDCNDIACTAWLTTVDVPIANGCIHGRPLAARKVYFYAVRESGVTEATLTAFTDAHGMATVTFADLPVSGSVDHEHCAQTPSGTWECYEFYASYQGLNPVQEYGGCIVETGCQSTHLYRLLEDSEVPTGCGGIPGCIEHFGGILAQLDVTLAIDSETLDGPTIFAIEQPPPPPPIGIPPEAAIADWRYVSDENVLLYPPAVAALDFTDTAIQGYGRLGTTIYTYEPGRSLWVPVAVPPDRSPLGNQIRWALEREGFYALVAFVDGDMDGIEDILENSLFLTHPGLADTDIDGIEDGDEQMLACTLPALADTDEDGFDDGDELAEGTDPNDPRDYPGAVDRGDHAIGNLLTTMTDKGTFGFTDLATLDGLGLIYPASGENLLFVGGLWAGTGPDRVANRDYEADSLDWEVAAHPDGHVVVGSPPEVDQVIRAAYNDSPHPQAMWLRIDQETCAWSQAPDDAFVLEHLTLLNEGLDALSGLYVGQFMDFDITAATSTANLGTSDPLRNLLTMWRAATPTPYVGVMLIEPATAANLTFIHNPTFVWPHACVLDADKYAFLSAADPQHIVPEAAVAADWSLLVSAGPLDLAVGESTTLGFALVAGGSPVELAAGADRARARYHALYSGGMAAGDLREAQPGAARLRASPNPLTTATTLRALLAPEGQAALGVYDIAGRLVRRLGTGTRAPAGEHIWCWDARDDHGRRLPPGVYHYRLQVRGHAETGRLMLVR